MKGKELIPEVVNSDSQNLLQQEQEKVRQQQQLVLLFGAEQAANITYDQGKWLATNLTLVNSQEQKLPDNLVVKGKFWIIDCPKLTQLGQGWKITDLHLIGCPQLQNFPTDIMISRMLFLVSEKNTPYSPLLLKQIRELEGGQIRRYYEVIRP